MTTAIKDMALPKEVIDNLLVTPREETERVLVEHFKKLTEYVRDGSRKNTIHITSVESEEANYKRITLKVLGVTVVGYGIAYDHSNCGYANMHCLSRRLLDFINGLLGVTANPNTTSLANRRDRIRALVGRSTVRPAYSDFIHACIYTALRNQNTFISHGVGAKGAVRFTGPLPVHPMVAFGKWLMDNEPESVHTAPVWVNPNSGNPIGEFTMYLRDGVLARTSKGGKTRTATVADYF